MPTARAVASAPRGGIWLGLMNGDLARYRYGKIEITPFKHNLNSRVHQIFVTSDGAVLGATTSGLIGWREGTQRTLTARNGLPCDAVNALIADRRGGLWFCMQWGPVPTFVPEIERMGRHARFPPSPLY